MDRRIFSKNVFTLQINVSKNSGVEPVKDKNKHFSVEGTDHLFINIKMDLYIYYYYYFYNIL